MTEPINLEPFDFGFSIVNEEELQTVQQVKQEIQQTTDEAEFWKARAEHWEHTSNLLYEHTIPLLNNLAANEEKEYIYWPNRTDKINAFKLKLLSILEN